MTNALTGWRKLRTPPDEFGEMDKSIQALLSAGKVLAIEEAKARSTREVAQRLADLAHNNHFADLIAATVKDNSTK